MAFQRGDVVLIPFPFTDLRAAKTRPAVVVNSGAYQQASSDIIVAMITSKPKRTETDLALEDWRSARLLHPSTVRCKLATLRPEAVRYRPGRLSERDMAGVDRCLRSALNL